MGTRALISILNKGKRIVTIYRHTDGYPSALGAEIKAFGAGMKIVNGIGDDDGKIANGMGCFAAQLVKHLKDDVGRIYLYEPETRDIGEEYTYELSNQDGRLWIKVHAGAMTAFGEPAREGRRPQDHPPIYDGLLDNYDPDAEEVAA